MEHQCQRCNALVPDSAPFCPNCRAPQIRVRVPEPNWEGADTYTSPAPEAAPSYPPRPDVEWQHPSRLNAQIALRSALIAGLLAALAGVVPLRGAIVIVLPLAGALSVALYRRRAQTPELSPRAGFRLGALTGLIASVISLVLTALATLMAHGENELREVITNSIHQAQERAGDPQSREAMKYFLTPEGMMIMMILGSVFVVVAFVLLGGLGGALSGSLRGKGSRSE